MIFEYWFAFKYIYRYSNVCIRIINNYLPVKYSTLWLRNLVFLIGTFFLNHLAMEYSSFEGFSTTSSPGGTYSWKIISINIYHLFNNMQHQLSNKNKQDVILNYSTNSYLNDPQLQNEYWQRKKSGGPYVVLLNSRPKHIVKSADTMYNRKIQGN